MPPDDGNEGGPVETMVEDRRWAEIGIEGIASRSCAAALNLAVPTGGRYEIGVLACGDSRMAELNSTYRDVPGPTNVIAWPAGRGDAAAPDDQCLGNLAISWETCAREASESGIPLADHASHLLVHGCLHLLGFGHKSDCEAAEMEEMEVRILAYLGIANPYTRSSGEAA